MIETYEPPEGYADFDVALILTVRAKTYEDALSYAEDLATGVGCDGENISAVFDYETDNEGQRIVYLHPENARS